MESFAILVDVNFYAVTFVLDLVDDINYTTWLEEVMAI